jgi:hypothetical protein
LSPRFLVLLVLGYWFDLVVLVLELNPIVQALLQIVLYIVHFDVDG